MDNTRAHKLNPEARSFSLLNPNIAEFVPTVEDGDAKQCDDSQKTPSLAIGHGDIDLTKIPGEKSTQNTQAFPTNILNETQQSRSPNFIANNSDLLFEKSPHFLGQNSIDEPIIPFYDDMSSFHGSPMYIPPSGSPSLSASQSWSANMNFFSPASSPQMSPLLSSYAPPLEWTSTPSTPNFPPPLPMLYSHSVPSPNISFAYSLSPNPLGTNSKRDQIPQWKLNSSEHSRSNRPNQYSIRELLRFRYNNQTKPKDWPDHLVFKRGKGVEDKDVSGNNNKVMKKRNSKPASKREHRRSRSSTFSVQERGSLQSLAKHRLSRGHSNSVASLEECTSSRRGSAQSFFRRLNSAPAELGVPQKKSVNNEKDNALATIRLILNKLTPDKFETLVANALNLQITSAETLALVIDTIYDKAVREPEFAALYAQLCSRLANKFSEFETEKGEKMNFRLILLKKCFNNMVKDEDFSALPDLERQVKQQKAKKMQKGNIILIGELFKQKLLTTAVVHLYIDMLLNLEQPDDNDIASLCHLLGTVGKDIDQRARESSKIDGYIEKMKILANNKNALSIRFRCLVKDIIELRERNWVRRIEKTIDPMKIKEIRDVFGKKINRKPSRMNHRQGKQKHNQGSSYHPKHQNSRWNKKPEPRSPPTSKSPKPTRQENTKKSSITRSSQTASNKSQKERNSNEKEPVSKKSLVNTNGSHSSNTTSRSGKKYQVREKSLKSKKTPIRKGSVSTSKEKINNK